MGSREQLAALRALYDGYLEDYRQRQIENGPFHGLQKFLLGSMSADDRKADAAFYQAVQQAVARLDEALEDDPGSGCAAQAVRLMILEAKGPDAASDLMFAAAQALAIPLVRRLPGGDRADILAAYRTRYPKKRLLAPKQRELLTELEQ